MIVGVEIYTNSDRKYEKVIGMLNMAFFRLRRRHLFAVHPWYFPRKEGDEKPQVVIEVLTKDERVFSFAKDFIYWAFEDNKRKHGFEVDYSIKHCKADPPPFLKGPGEV